MWVHALCGGCQTSLSSVPLAHTAHRRTGQIGSLCCSMVSMGRLIASAMDVCSLWRSSLPRQPCGMSKAHSNSPCWLNALRMLSTSSAQHTASKSVGPAKSTAGGTTGPPASEITSGALSVASSSSTESTDLQHLLRPPRLCPPGLPLQPERQAKLAKYAPWVFSRHLVPLRHVRNRMGFLMQSLESEQVS